MPRRRLARRWRFFGSPRAVALSLAYAVTAGLTLLACAGANSSSASSGANAPVGEASAPAWENALPEGAELFARLRVAALLRDERLHALVDPLERAALPAGDARIVLSPVIAVSDELVVSARGGAQVIVLIGVRADTWPDAIRTPAGEPAFREVAHTEHITEQQTADGEMSLFTLPGRTWVIATGTDRPRVRRALLSPRAREAPDVDFAVAELRIRGADLVKRLPQLGAGNLADIGARLDTLHLRIEKRPERMNVHLNYRTNGETARAERLLRHIKEVAGRSDKLPWLANAEIQSSGSQVSLLWRL